MVEEVHSDLIVEILSHKFVDFTSTLLLTLTFLQISADEKAEVSPEQLAQAREQAKVTFD